MLDEILEYEEYTNIEKERICKNDAKDMTYRRPFVIIARECIFNKLEHDINTEITDDEIEKTIKEIETWRKEFLPGYLIKLLGNEEKAKKFIDKIPDLSGKEKSKNGNDVNDLTYYNIIADALERGPLTKYYLVAKEIGTRGKYEEIFGKISLVPPKERKKLNKTELLNSMLMIISAYLINIAEGNEWCFLSGCDLYRWGVYYDFWKCEVTFDGKKVFEKEILKNNTKIYVNPKFINECGLCVMNETDLNKEIKDNKNLLYYTDAGAKNILKGSWDKCQS